MVPDALLILSSRCEWIETLREFLAFYDQDGPSWTSAGQEKGLGRPEVTVMCAESRSKRSHIGKGHLLWGEMRGLGDFGEEFSREVEDDRRRIPKGSSAGCVVVVSTERFRSWLFVVNRRRTRFPCAGTVSRRAALLVCRTMVM